VPRHAPPKTVELVLEKNGARNDWVIGGAKEDEQAS